MHAEDRRPVLCIARVKTVPLAPKDRIPTGQVHEVLKLAGVAADDVVIEGGTEDTAVRRWEGEDVRNR